MISVETSILNEELYHKTYTCSITLKIALGAQSNH
jgi:hypothetical protein